MPRTKVPEIKLPAEGIFFGSASYGSDANVEHLGLGYTGHAHCRWCGARPSPSDEIRLTVSEGLGNVLQFWQTDDYLYRLSAEAMDAGVLGAIGAAQQTSGEEKQADKVLPRLFVKALLLV